jgi:hypothetical protein
MTFDYFLVVLHYPAHKFCIVMSFFLCVLCIIVYILPSLQHVFDPYILNYFVHSSHFLVRHIRKVVEDDVGAENVVQIVTDNGSNYKAACKQLLAKHKHITWQPCAAHTINLMLKEISSFPEVDEVVRSAQQMCKFFHSHNR